MEFKDTSAWSVIGSTGNTYHLVKTEDGITCDCLGFMNRKYCKHVDALKETLKPSIAEMREALINHDAEWALENTDKSEFIFLFKHGFKGYINCTNNEIEIDYEDKIL